MTLNILDTSEKRKILTEYRLRLAAASVAALGGLVLASSVLLVPPYVFSITKYNNAQDNIDVLEQKYGNSTKEKEIAAQIRDINSKIILLTGETQSTNLAPLDVIRTILKIKSNTIKIDGISYDSTGGVERIVLSGMALTRDGLATFVEELKNEPSFTSVSLPISSYVKSVNINFSIAIDGKQATPATKKSSASSNTKPF